MTVPAVLALFVKHIMQQAQRQAMSSVSPAWHENECRCAGRLNFWHLQSASVYVTVPAYFSDGQKRETEQAFTIAGCQVVRTTSEPAAAAYYCFADTRVARQDDQLVLVFDMGGGTLDVTVMRKSEGTVHACIYCMTHVGA